MSYKTKTHITDRTIAVAEAFGLGVDDYQRHVVYDKAQLKIRPRDIVYITGESGSGKSVLLKALEKDIRKNPELGAAINITDIQVDPDKPLIDTVGKTVEEGLELLSRVGLNDAFLFLRRYRELSDGQRYRYRIAKLIESGAQWWILDEFCATLIVTRLRLLPSTCRSMLVNLEEESLQLPRTQTCLKTLNLQ